MHGPDSRDEKLLCLSSNFRGRQTDIVAHRGAVCNHKGFGSLDLDAINVGP